MSNPERECRRLFAALGLSKEHVGGAVETLERDSQGGTYGKRGERPKLSEELVGELASYLATLRTHRDISFKTCPDHFRTVVALNKRS